MKKYDLEVLKWGGWGRWALGSQIWPHLTDCAGNAKKHNNNYSVLKLGIVDKCSLWAVIFLNYDMMKV